MSNNFMTREMVNRLFSVMREKNITTSYLCKILNVNYKDFTATCEGKSPMYNKWQKKIAEALGVDRNELFYEFCSSNLRSRLLKNEQSKPTNQI